MPLFPQKKEMSSQAPAAELSLADLVLRMRDQGLSNNQIIASLQRQGVDTTQIFDAMNQAELRMQSAGPRADELPPGYQQQAAGAPQFQPDQYAEQDAQAYMPAPQAFAYDESEVDKIEELVEAVVEEKWVDLVKDVNKIIEWKAEVESDIVALKQKIEDLKGTMVELQKGIIGKVEDYDRNIGKVNTNLKAMENVFQKVIPTFTENINELSHTVDSLKSIVNKDSKR